MKIQKVIFLILMSLSWGVFAYAADNANPNQGTMVYRFDDANNSAAIAVSDQPFASTEEFKAFSMNAQFSPVALNSEIANPLQTGTDELIRGRGGMYYGHSGGGHWGGHHGGGGWRGGHHHHHGGSNFYFYGGYWYPYYGYGGYPYYYDYDYCYWYRSLRYCY